MSAIYFPKYAIKNRKDFILFHPSYSQMLREYQQERTEDT